MPTFPAIDFSKTAKITVGRKHRRRVLLERSTHHVKTGPEGIKLLCVGRIESGRINGSSLSVRLPPMLILGILFIP